MNFMTFSFLGLIREFSAPPAVSTAEIVCELLVALRHAFGEGEGAVANCDRRCTSLGGESGSAARLVEQKPGHELCRRQVGERRGAAARRVAMDDAFGLHHFEE